MNTPMGKKKERKRGHSTFSIKERAEVPLVPETGLEPALPVKATRPST
jgi:hypothetical protein